MYNIEASVNYRYLVLGIILVFFLLLTLITIALISIDRNFARIRKLIEQEIIFKRSSSQEKANNDSRVE